MLWKKIGIKIVKWWVGKGLPDVHIFYDARYDLPGLIRRWFLHPVKRRSAKYYLIFLRSVFKIKVVCITGSAGKTTVKDMLTSILQYDGNTIASYKNIDPIFNIPTTILRCRPSTKYLVLEMGVEYPGEMDFYLWLARPDIAIITNINPTHLEYFGSINNVFKEKYKLVLSTSAKDSVILNHDDIYLNRANDNIKGKIVYVGKDTDIYADGFKVDKTGSLYTLNIHNKKINIRLPIIGSHFVNNSLAAAGAAYELGITPEDIKKGLESFKIPEHRMNIVNLKNGSVLIDDTYNSNPQAVKETLENFVELSKLYEDHETGIVFGDMLELGKFSEIYHREVGNIISKMKIVFIICVGEESESVKDEIDKNNPKIKTYTVRDHLEAYNKVKKLLLGRKMLLLLKGSRSIGLDGVVKKLSQ